MPQPAKNAKRLRVRLCDLNAGTLGVCGAVILLACRARYDRLDQPLSPTLEATLRGVGAERLYTHQAQAINAVRAGQHIILCTGTASGKTLAYNIPVLESLIADPQARALYLFPTKHWPRISFAACASWLA